MQRQQATRQEALQIIDILLSRRFDGPLPPLSTAALIYDWEAHLTALPLLTTLPLHGRAMFAPTSLDEVARHHSAAAREVFFSELGDAVGLSARALHAAVRARRFPLEPPQPVAGYEYLGAFLSEGKLDIADPCHLRKPSLLSSIAFSLSYPTAALSGTWHVFVRNGHGDMADRTAELAVIHERGFATVATQKITSIGVDVGVAGVFDRACPPVDTSDVRIEGVVHGLGAYAHSGYGDGVYPVFAGYSYGQIAKLRIAFFEEDAQTDATLPVRASKRYAVSATFELGDSIEHPKFGTGAVVRVANGKIDVDFAGDLRTLIHGRR
jgi:hypothetical protein